VKGIVSLIILAAPLLVLMFLVMQRSSRQRRQMSELQESISPGQHILTTSGLHAVVVEVEDGVVTLETGPGQRSRWDSRAIMRVFADEEPDVTVSMPGHALSTPQTDPPAVD